MGQCCGNPRSGRTSSSTSSHTATRASAWKKVPGVSDKGFRAFRAWVGDFPADDQSLGSKKRASKGGSGSGNLLATLCQLSEVASDLNAGLEVRSGKDSARLLFILRDALLDQQQTRATKVMSVRPQFYLPPSTRKTSKTSNSEILGPESGQTLKKRKPLNPSTKCEVCRPARPFLASPGLEWIFSKTIRHCPKPHIARRP